MSTQRRIIASGRERVVVEVRRPSNDVRMLAIRHSGCATELRRDGFALWTDVQTEMAFKSIDDAVKAFAARCGSR